MASREEDTRRKKKEDAITPVSIHSSLRNCEFNNGVIEMVQSVDVSRGGSRI